nr:alternative oxidase [Oncomelania hupensis]
MSLCFSALTIRPSACAVGALRSSFGASALKLSAHLSSCARTVDVGAVGASIQFPQIRTLSTDGRITERTFASKPKHTKCADCTCATCSNKVRMLSTTETQLQQVEGNLKKQIQENVKQAEEGKFNTMPDPGHLEHFMKRSQKTEVSSVHQSATPKSGISQSSDSRSSVNQSATDISIFESEPPMGVYTLPHPIWSEKELHEVQITHTPPEGKVDKLAYFTVKILRGSFDILSGFKRGERNEFKWLKRIIFLETVAGVPGMVAAMMRHMISLRRMQRDHGWIHTLLEEAENERMHLMTALQLKQPSWFFRTAVIGSQGVFVTLFSIWYVISPRFCHRFVGYLEEEAVKTYSKCLEDIRGGPMKHWQTVPAPEVAIRYWKLPEDAKMVDVILAIRADEAHHRVVNHTLASLKANQFNPYKPGQ